MGREKAGRFGFLVVSRKPYPLIFEARDGSPGRPDLAAAVRFAQRRAHSAAGRCAGDPP